MFGYMQLVLTMILFQWSWQCIILNKQRSTVHSSGYRQGSDAGQRASHLCRQFVIITQRHETRQHLQTAVWGSYALGR
jgi:hypothetical protein